MRQNRGERVNNHAEWRPIITASASSASSPSAPILFRGDLLRTISRAADIGFSGIDLHTSAEEEVDWTALKKSLSSSRMCLSSIATGGLLSKRGLSISHQEAGIREEAIRHLKRLMIRAGEFGSVVIIGIVRGSLSTQGQACSIERYSRLVNSLRVMSGYAKEAGCTLAVEAIAFPESDCINDSASALRLIETVDSDALLINLDLHHMLAMGEDPPAAIRNVAGSIGCFHISDAGRTCPGTTEMNLKPILTALREVGYRGALSLEYAPCEEGCSRIGTIEEDEQDIYARIGLNHLKSQLDGI